MLSQSSLLLNLLRITAAVLTALALLTLAHAHSPEGSDPAMAGWFRSLTRPDTGTSCCTEQDCDIIDMSNVSIRDGIYWVRDPRPGPDEEWLRVSPTRVLDRENPTGKYVVCITGHTVLCFLRPVHS